MMQLVAVEPFMVMSSKGILFTQSISPLEKKVVKDFHQM